MSDEEVWKPVLGGKGLYEVSSHGNVRRLWKKHTRPKKSNPMPGGYRYMNLGRTIKPKFVHVLVLEAFVGPRPPGMFTDHIDYNRTNNRLDNLRWVTRAENTAHSLERNRAANCGEMGNRAKLTAEKIQAIRVSKEPPKVLAERYGITPTHVWYIRTGRTWKHLPWPEES